MKIINIKSFIMGLIIGIVGITSVFGAGIIKSVEYTDCTFMINGEEINLNNPFVSIVKQGESNSNLYMPIREVLQKLGYNVQWYENNNTIDISTSQNPYYVNSKDNITSNKVIDLKNRGTFNMSESGVFQAKDNQVLKLEVNANLINGSVDFVLFNPSGEQQEFITIDNMSETRTINLSKGQWAYSCSGMFRGGGNCHIIGVIQ